jgi:hypothetical protein
MADCDAERALKLSVQGFLKLPEKNAVITAEIERILNR